MSILQIVTTTTTTAPIMAQQTLFKQLQLPSILVTHHYPPDRSMLGSVRQRRPSSNLNLESTLEMIFEIMPDKK